MRLCRLARPFVCVILTVLATFALVGQTTTQVTNQAQGFTFAGLHAAGTNTKFLSVRVEVTGTLLVLDDEGDGIRVLRLGGTNHELISQTLLGASGDHGTQLTLGPAGEIYLTGTLSSGALSATVGAAISQPPAGKNSTFVAHLDSALGLQWLSFTGASRSNATAIAANASGVFVTGFLYGTDLPVSPNALQQTPAVGSFQNGFLENFTVDGTSLKYATYLTGADGDTTPSGIAVDAGSNAWVVGSTTASGFPTISAIVPEIQSSTSGFIAQVTPAGDGFVWSSFVPGDGLAGITLDSTGTTLFISGTISLKDFPVDTVEFPMVATPYQVLLRLSLNGTTIISGTVIAPGIQSSVTASNDGGAWVSGVSASTDVPTSPRKTLATIGNGFSVHISSTGKTDQVVRLGGLPTSNLAFASIPLQVNSTVMTLPGRLMIAGSIEPTASANLLDSETYDLPLIAGSSSALNSSVRDGEVSGAGCSGSLCAGSVGYLGEVDVQSSGDSLLLSADDFPLLTLRNLATSPATGIALASSLSQFNSSCGPVLAPAAECGIMIQGSAAGLLTVTADGNSTSTFSYPAPRSFASERSLFVSPREIDFGIQVSSSSYATKGLTLTNLGSNSATLVSAPAVGLKQLTPFSLDESDCSSIAIGTITLAAGSSCQMRFSFSASSDPSQDGSRTMAWTLGTHQILLTGYSRAASLSPSSKEINFGTFLNGSKRYPRYLFLSNQSDIALSHTPVKLPSTSAFSVTDECPSIIQAGELCRLTLLYQSLVVPSVDDVDLDVDHLTIQVTGSTVAPANSTGSVANPDLSVIPLSETFSDPVVVTGVSASAQTIAISNSGSASIALSVTLTGDFSEVSSCPAILNPGSSCAVAITFTPTQAGIRRGLVTISSGPNSSPALVPLSGAGLGILPDNNGSLPFGTTPVSQPMLQFYKITEPLSSLTVRTLGPYEVKLVEDTGTGHGIPSSSTFATDATGTCYNCWLAVSFQPEAIGLQLGTMTVSSNPNGLPYHLDLSGVGTAITGLVLTPNVVDFGSVPVNSASGTTLFLFSNMGSAGAPVMVTQPLSSDSFVVTTPPLPYSSCEGLLSAGTSCAFQVAFAPLRIGMTNNTLSVVTSAGNVMTQLSGMGTPDPGIGISPESLTFLNGSGISATQQSIDLVNTGSVPVVVGQSHVDVASFATSSTCGILFPLGTCAIKVTFSPTQSTVNGTLTIPVARQGQQQIYSIALSGRYTVGETGLSVSPGSADFGPSATGSGGFSRQYSIFNSTLQPLSLILSVPRQFSLTTSPCPRIASGTACGFTLTSIPLTNGDISGTILIQGLPTDGSPIVSTRAYAESFGVGSGKFLLSGGSLSDGNFSFGLVASGQTATKTFVLTHAGTANAPPITVRRIRSAPPFLSKTTCRAALQPGGSCSITVTYSPTNQGPATQTSSTPSPDAGVLSIESDAQSSPDTVQLTGLAGAANVSSAGSTTNLSDYTLSQESMTFARTTVGNISDSQQALLTNTGNTPITILATAISSDFSLDSSCTTVAPGEACTLVARSKPQTGGKHLGTIEISTDATQSLQFISLFSTADPSPLQLSPGLLSFGAVGVGRTSTLPLDITNVGTLPITFQSFSTGVDFSASGTCPLSGQSLAPQNSCALNVTFSPSATGTRLSALTLGTSASSFPLFVPLTGIGTAAALNATPASLDFGKIAVGATASRTLTITNNGTSAAAALQSIISGDFQATSPCSQTTLQAGAHCTTTLRFSPASLGPANGALTFTTSSSSLPLVVPLAGTGVSNGDFALVVGGESSATVTIVQGDFATFSLRLDPLGQFSGSIALSCQPLQTVLYANCTVAPSIVPLASGTQYSVGTINTVTIGQGVSAKNTSGKTPRIQAWHAVFALTFLGLSLFPPNIGRRFRETRTRGFIVLTSLAAISLISGGCGSGNNLNARFTAPGIYHFQMQGNSTSGIQLSHSVTLTLIVTQR